ncbi:B-box zinc finger protein [Tunturiibacter empetritectus]|uniref:B-box zinc finger protein n=1 Tax=Tunturiibacter empetritectus TaxID=3069691 RepID=UPI003D9AFA29
MTCANHPERERIAFCQNCGKPLCQECTRTVGSAVFCEPCLAAKLAGTPPPPGAASDARQPGAPADTVWQSGAGMPSGWQPPAGPNPGLAALLGFIPGVGAMYNGQYAKGVVHLVVFAILVSLADNHGIFGLFIAGWVCYQVIEAYHTAKARRDGTRSPIPSA